MGYILIRLTSKPLKKSKYNINEVKHPASFSVKTQKEVVNIPKNKPTAIPYSLPSEPSVEEKIRRAEEKTEQNINKVLNDSRTAHEELVDIPQEAEELLEEEQPEEKKNVLKMLFQPNPYKKQKKEKKKKKKEKTVNNTVNNNEEVEEKKEKKKFSIWEEIPEEPRDTSQLESAEIINKDGYYNTVQPIDAEDFVKEKSEFNWKIPLLVLIGLIALGFLGYSFFFM